MFQRSEVASQSQHKRKRMAFLFQQLRMLRAIGYDMQPKESRFRWLISVANLILLFSIMWYEGAYVYTNRDNIKNLTDGLCPLIYGFAAGGRLLSFRLRKRRFYELVWRLKAAWQAATAGDQSVLETEFRRENRVSHPYIVSANVVGILYLAVPLLTLMFQLIRGEELTRVIPMRATFNYDVTRSPNYELTYLWFIHATFLSTCCATGIDTLFYAAAYNLSAHFKIIQQHVKRIEYDPNEKNAGQKHPLRELRNLIVYHNEIFKLAQHLTQTYQPIMLLQFSVSSLQICVVAFQLTLPDLDVQSLVTYATFLLVMSSQCFVYCHGGSRLEEESKAVSNALYAGQWYTGTVRMQMNVAFCIRRAQIPVVVKAAFFSANLLTFSSILQTAGSYIALLQTLSDE